MNRLQNKKIVVVGGSAGMGLAIASLAASKGAEVIIGGRTELKLEAAAVRIGAACRPIVVDTGSEESVASFFDQAGAVDHLTTPGSSVRTGAFMETSADNIRFSMENKFLGQALCAKHCRLNEGGSIVLFSGILAQRPGTSSLLGAVNAAVECLAKGLARELAPIRVNVVSPGMTSGTDAYSSMPDDARNAMFDSFREKLPTGSVGTPEDMAEAALFLMASPFITGQTLNVDGGGLVT